MNVDVCVCLYVYICVCVESRDTGKRQTLACFAHVSQSQSNVFSHATNIYTALLESNGMYLAPSAAMHMYALKALEAHTVI